MKYLYKGTVVESSTSLDSTLFVPIKEEKQAEKEPVKPATKKRSVKNVRDSK